MRVVYYYQTLTDLRPLVRTPNGCTDLIICSLHFGFDKDNQPYLHLNDHDVTDSRFAETWAILRDLEAKTGIRPSVMLGGAGGAFTQLFARFDLFYPLLAKFLTQMTFLKGIDLDVEQPTQLGDLEFLIRRLHVQFGNRMAISLAPVSGAIQTDSPGMGGFSYRELMDACGDYIDRFHVQCYDGPSAISVATVQTMVENGYSPEQLVVGMCGDNGDWAIQLANIRQVQTAFPDLGGFFVWEYCLAPPSQNDPTQWAKAITTKNDVAKTANFSFYLSDCVIL